MDSGSWNICYLPSIPRGGQHRGLGPRPPSPLERCKVVETTPKVRGWRAMSFGRSWPMIPLVTVPEKRPIAPSAVRAPIWPGIPRLSGPRFAEIVVSGTPGHLGQNSGFLALKPADLRQAETRSGERIGGSRTADSERQIGHNEDIHVSTRGQRRAESHFRAKSPRTPYPR